MKRKALVTLKKIETKTSEEQMQVHRSLSLTTKLVATNMIVLNSYRDSFKLFFRKVPPET
jgi:hypothetical protein